MTTESNTPGTPGLDAVLADASVHLSLACSQTLQSYCGTHPYCRFTYVIEREGCPGYAGEFRFGDASGAIDDAKCEIGGPDGKPMGGPATIVVFKDGLEVARHDWS